MGSEMCIRDRCISKCTDFFVFQSTYLHGPYIRLNPVDETLMTAGFFLNGDNSGFFTLHMDVFEWGIVHSFANSPSFSSSSSNEGSVCCTGIARGHSGMVKSDLVCGEFKGKQALY